ncbi:MAG TPA: hypothetical protein VMG60_00815 [Burkholderiaceae bacterium]|nr:hypothetical protein [Burkholderiaceae bacterium]
MESSLAQRVLWILWPAFLVAAAAELLFFALFDPSDLRLFGVPIEIDRVSVYTMGFFFFWAMAAAASAMTVLLQRSPFEVNRSRLNAGDRVPGGPNRAAQTAATDAPAVKPPAADGRA